MSRTIKPMQLDVFGIRFMFFLTAMSCFIIYHGVYDNLTQELVGGYAIFCSVFWGFFAIAVGWMPAKQLIAWVINNHFWRKQWWVQKSKEREFLREAHKIDWYIASHRHQSCKISEAIPSSLIGYEHRYVRNNEPVNEQGFVFGFELVNKRTGGVAYRRVNVHEGKCTNRYYVINCTHID